MSGFDYDLVIIGGGSGGSATCKRAAGYGARVAIIDRGVTRDANGNRVGAGLGGTCVNVGCVPKKIMYFAAHHNELLRGPTATAAGYGITGIDEGNIGFDWAAVKLKRDADVARLNATYERGWKKAGVEVILGTGTVASTNSVHVVLNDGSERSLTTKYILIAVGGIPCPLTIPGGDLAINSDGFFDLEEAPKKCLVIGAGYIAVELAGILHAVGSDTTLMFRGETVLRHGFDKFIVKILMEELEAHGPTLAGQTTPKELIREDDGTITAVCTTTVGQEVRLGGFDVVLSAIGRLPVSKGLGLEQVGVKLDAYGYVNVDKYQQTTVDSICAVGDATRGFQLTPVAIAAGRRLADRLFGGEPRARVQYFDIPTVVFSHPPIGTIGLTETQARKEFPGQKIRALQASFKSMFYVFNPPEKKVKTGLKLVLLGEEERVVGLHMIGPSSDEMLQGFAVAVRMGATRRDFEATVAIHPTIGEELVTFGGWGQDESKTKAVLPQQLEAEDASKTVAKADGGGKSGGSAL